MKEHKKIDEMQAVECKQADGKEKLSQGQEKVEPPSEDCRGVKSEEKKNDDDDGSSKSESNT